MPARGRVEGRSVRGSAGQTQDFHLNNKINKRSNVKVEVRREHSRSGAGGRDNIGVPKEANHDSETLGLAETNNTLGAGGEARQSERLPRDEPVKLPDVKLRFEAMTAARLRSSRTRTEYWNRFVTFAECEGLTRYSPKELSGRKGRELLISHYNHISERSRPYVISSLRKVWTRGLDLRWPLEKDDLPRPPRPRRGIAPRREYVQAWVEAARSEKDPYERSWLLVELNGGLRPIDQGAELRIADLVFNGVGDLIGIHAQSADHPDFKRDADVRQVLAPEAAAALKEWLQGHPKPSSECYVWPWRSKSGRLQIERLSTQQTVDRMRRNFAKRNGLPWLTSKDLRHFCRTVLNDSGMAKVERHYYQGHKANPTDMDEQYGDRSVEETFEAQRRALPGGVLGTFLRERATGESVPAELRDIWSRLLAGEMEADEAAKDLRALVRLQRKQIVSNLAKP